MNTQLEDANERQSALDPTQSFIVQAPAGSGKTELLTQRFLVLLSQVSQPEEILALTFTKKAAAEMRARIIQALQLATGAAPIGPHAQKTWGLAKSALLRNATLKWDLLNNPNRLRIQTIDSFNTYLTKTLPILSQFGAAPDIVNDARTLYRAAVYELLSHLEEDLPWSKAIEQLLEHFDNDLNQVANLLVQLLAKRDQWLPYVTLKADVHLRRALESHLASITMDALMRLKEVFPKTAALELIPLIQYAANHLKTASPSSAIVSCLTLADLPGTTVQDKLYWSGISELLLTKELKWRKRVDKSIGFPAATSAKNAAEKAEWADLKQRMVNLIETLSQNDHLHSALIELNGTPAYFYQEEEWHSLQAFLQLLQVAAAQLKIIFQQTKQIDYIENAQAALLALGDEEGPTDLALNLDYKIQHILIDEFQDTSTGQYRLIEKLVLGWAPSDGRTLFVVGDPMQSIYRFREAEVGLFISARLHGIGPVKLTPLTLTVNFRSKATLVHWNNAHFKSVLPPLDTISMGAVAYSPSAPHDHTDPEEQTVFLHGFIKDETPRQAEAIVQLVQSIKQSRPTASIAILVRSRTHLLTILPALKKAQLCYRAIEIDPLIGRPIIQDLLSLTRALLHPADRLSWLAVLRAPWCGLSLKDLWAIAHSKEGGVSIWERARALERQAALSDDGLKRLKKCLPVLENKLLGRQREGLRPWVEDTWMQLGGPACLSEIHELEDANVFFELLATLDQGGDLVDMAHFNESIEKLYASPNIGPQENLQIMTIHNAKGLEFDVVILPHLESKPPNPDKQLLLWMQRARLKGQAQLILAPIAAIGQPANSIYEYIKKQNQMKTDHEYGRLLYVAATRAKQQLHLLFSLPDDKPDTAPLQYSLLEKLWQTIKHEVLLQKPLTAEVGGPIKVFNTLVRISDDWQHPLNGPVGPLKIAYHEKKLGFHLNEDFTKHLGTQVHLLLQQIAEQGEIFWRDKTRIEKKLFLAGFFIQAGIAHHETGDLVEKTIFAIENTLQDERGRWILRPHTEAQSELHLTAVMGPEIRSLVIDRTFIDETGTRWIIDYKTSMPSSHENCADFLSKEKHTYTKALERYAKGLQLLYPSPSPLRLGLYFPLLPAWIEWEFINS